MIPAFPGQLAAMLLQVADDIRPLHAVSFSQSSIGFKDALASLAQVCPGLLQCGALGIGARDLLDEGDVALGTLRKTAVSSSAMRSSR